MFDHYLTPYELKEMRKNYRMWIKDGWERLPGANTRALYKVDNNKVVLQSYYTDVIMIDIDNNAVYKLWNGYSVTTLKHINTLLNMFKMPAYSKKEWENLKVDKAYYV